VPNDLQFYAHFLDVMTGCHVWNESLEELIAKARLKAVDAIAREPHEDGQHPDLGLGKVSSSPRLLSFRLCIFWEYFCADIDG
jgi:hypothetical protein